MTQDDVEDPVNGDPPAELPPIGDEPVEPDAPGPDEPDVDEEPTEPVSDPPGPTYFGTVTIGRGDTVPVELECVGVVTATIVEGGTTVPFDRLDTMVFSVGDHLVELSCDGEPLTELTIQVVEPSSGSVSGPTVVSAILMFVVLVALTTVVAPGGLGAGYLGRKVGS